MISVRRRKACSYILVAMSLTACGGGGDDGDSSVVNDSPGGIWRGSVTLTATGATYQSIGLITETGELHFLTTDGEQTTGNVTVSGKTFSANITSYAPLGSVFDNGSTVISGTASGSINQRSTFSGSARFSGTVTSNFSYTYDSIYERDSILSLISGLYFDYDGSGYWVTYDIDSQGVITGSDTDGCQFNGNVKLINPDFNMYRINITATSCGDLNGDYTGLAALMDDGGSQNNTLAVSVSGSKYVISSSLHRDIPIPIACSSPALC